MLRMFIALLLLVVQVHAEEGYAILQGASGKGTAQFSVMVPVADFPIFAVKPGDGTSVRMVRFQERIEHSASRMSIERLTFVGLAVGVTHKLVCVLDEKVKDEREFTIPDWSRAKGRVFIGSCLDDQFDKEQKQIWPEIFAARPDAIFLIGDNAYCDVKDGLLLRDPTPAHLWHRHVVTRSKLALYRAKTLVPVFSTWDDHDYGKNNAGREFPHSAASKRIFRAFFPQAEIDGFLEHGPGVSAKFTLFGQRWMLLDGRSFRSPNRKDVPDQTMFGKRQEAWIDDALSEATPTWLVSGAQFFGGYHRFESYETCQARSFAAFRARVSEGVAPAAFISGDRHLAELMRIDAKECGFVTYELTTSAIHARTYPGSFAKEPNPRQIHGKDGAMNYALLDVESAASTEAPSLKAMIRVLGLGKVVHFEHAINVTRKAAR